MEEKNRMKILAGAAINLNESKIINSPKALEAIEIIDKYDYLKKAFKYIILNNNSNSNPYHNLNHLLTVMKYCYLGAISEKITDEKELSELLIAAIFHDVNHSGGKKTDDINIKNSKKSIKDFIESQDIDVDLEVINEILDATEYPYVIDSSKLNIRQSIIRDADLMQVFEYNWIHQNILGLSTELKMNFLDFVKPQRKFLDSVEFNTKWGKEMKKERWKDVVNQYEMFERACNVKLKG